MNRLFREPTMVASVPFLGKVGASFDSKCDRRDLQRTKTKENDGKLRKNTCRYNSHFDFLGNYSIVEDDVEQNKGGKQGLMMMIYKEMVYNPWLLI